VFSDEAHQIVKSRESGIKNTNLDPRKVSHFDLMLHVTDEINIIRIIFEYSTDLFKKSTVKKFARSYMEILEQVIENQNIKLNEINISLNLLPTQSTIIQEDNDEWEL
jgi:phosphosulfolactate synthase (CoM biosynthesis protein A)